MIASMLRVALFLFLSAVVWLPAAASYGARSGPAKKAAGPAVKVDTVSPQEVNVLVHIGVNPLLVDTRSEEEFRKLHVTGAVNLPSSRKVKPPVDLPRNRMLILYCDCAEDSVAADAARELIREGYSEVKVLKGGLGGWICQNLSVEGEMADRTSCQ